MEEKKVFGYPQFDNNGEMILTTYDNAYRDMMMDIRVYQLKKEKKKASLVQKKKLQYFY